MEGVSIIHIDCHMGVGFIPELFEMYTNLGFEYNVPVLVPYQIKEILNLYKLHAREPEYYFNQIQSLQEKNVPLVDHFLITPCFTRRTAVEGYIPCRLP